MGLIKELIKFKIEYQSFLKDKLKEKVYFGD
jgi:hypothetical protein